MRIAARAGNFSAITSLIGAILMEQSDEWSVQRRRYTLLETMVPVSDNAVGCAGT